MHLTFSAIDSHHDTMPRMPRMPCHAVQCRDINNAIPYHGSATQLPRSSLVRTAFAVMFWDCDGMGKRLGLKLRLRWGLGLKLRLRWGLGNRNSDDGMGWLGWGSWATGYCIPCGEPMARPQPYVGHFCFLSFFFFFFFFFFFHSALLRPL